MNNAVFLYTPYSLFKYVFVIESKFLAHQIIVKYVAFQELDLLLVKIKTIIFSGQKAIILTHALNSTAKRCTYKAYSTVLCWFRFNHLILKKNWDGDFNWLEQESSNTLLVHTTQLPINTIYLKLT